MSQRLTLVNVLEKLQGVLFDLHDLSQLQTGKDFTGITLRGLVLAYRDNEPTYWTIEITPTTLAVATEAELVEEPEEEPDPADIREEQFVEGYEEGRR